MESRMINYELILVSTNEQNEDSSSWSSIQLQPNVSTFLYQYVDHTNHDYPIIMVSHCWIFLVISIYNFCVMLQRYGSKPFFSWIFCGIVHLYHSNNNYNWVFHFIPIWTRFKITMGLCRLHGVGASNLFLLCHIRIGDSPLTKSAKFVGIWHVPSPNKCVCWVAPELLVLQCFACCMV